MKKNQQKTQLVIPELVKEKGEYFIIWYSNENQIKKIKFKVLSHHLIKNYDDQNIISKFEIVEINTVQKMAAREYVECLDNVYEPNEILAQYVIHGENAVSGFIQLKAVSEFSNTPIKPKAFLNYEEFKKIINKALPTNVESY